MSFEIIKNIKKYFTSDICMDLGSKSIRIYDPNNDLKILDYSAVTVLEHMGMLNIVSIGENSHFMRGKTPKNQRVVYPIKKGVVSDFDAAFVMLEGYFQKIMKEHPNKFFKPSSNVFASVPLGICQMEERHIKELLMKVGAANINLFPQSLAAWIAIDKARYNIQNEKTNLLVHFGAETTEIIAVVNNEIIFSKNLEYGSDDITVAIVKHLKSTLGYDISYSVAEKIKVNFLNCIPTENSSQIKESFSGLNNGLAVSELLISELECYRAVIPEITRFLKDFLEFWKEDLTIEAKTDISNFSVFVTGGGSLIKNYVEVISKNLDLNFEVVDSPELKTIEGLCIMQSLSEDD